MYTCIFENAHLQCLDFQKFVAAGVLLLLVALTHMHFRQCVVSSRSRLPTPPPPSCARSDTDVAVANMLSSRNVLCVANILRCGLF
ncbi:hypothetical protein TSAR_006644 [Trichomalopsis sarcophagae]|uniref:Uncharacterized protein n=1 Tax=Trichomalopsis sarcophagae TaxID=543379 RepID=A0A232EXX4_9HYME|nr:hypothetical protein TSAR_006644 [Trichomalopsis sarcophagae]